MFKIDWTRGFGVKRAPKYACGLVNEYVPTGTSDVGKRDILWWLRERATDTHDSAEPTFVKDKP